jgi:hypothetical protein
MMIALSLGLCKPLFRCRPAIALCHRDRAGQAAGPAISAMPRKRQLAVKMAPVAMGQRTKRRRRGTPQYVHLCSRNGVYARQSASNVVSDHAVTVRFRATISSWDSFPPVAMNSLRRASRLPGARDWSADRSAECNSFALNSVQ